MKETKQIIKKPLNTDEAELMALPKAELVKYAKELEQNYEVIEETTSSCDLSAGFFKPKMEDKTTKTIRKKNKIGLGDQNGNY